MRSARGAKGGHVVLLLRERGELDVERLARALPLAAAAGEGVLLLNSRDERRRNRSEVKV